MGYDIDLNQHKRRNQYDVQQDRGGGGRRKPLQCVQHPAQQGNERHKGQVGKGDAGQLDGQREFFRLVGKPRGNRIHQPRHEQYRQDRKDH